MREIKEGEFCRINGEIAKVIGKDDDNNILLDTQKIVTKQEIKKVKHSFNIINLIEINDILNESLVVDLFKTLKDINKPEEGMTEIIYLENGQVINKSNEIKNILTHEQFEKNCYNVGLETLSNEITRIEAQLEVLKEE